MAKITRSTATTSWIDERLFSLTLPEVDWGSQDTYINSSTIRREVILGAEAYRFANFIEAFVEVQGSRITSHGFTSRSGMCIVQRRFSKSSQRPFQSGVTNRFRPVQ